MIVFCDIICDCTEVSIDPRFVVVKIPCALAAALSQSIHEHILVRCGLWEVKYFMTGLHPDLWWLFVVISELSQWTTLTCCLLAASHKHTHTHTHCSLQMSCMPCSLSCHTPLNSFILSPPPPPHKQQKHVSTDVVSLVLCLLLKDTFLVTRFTFLVSKLTIFWPLV